MAVEIGRMEIQHRPFLPARVRIEDIKVFLHGDPLVHLDALAKAWHGPHTELDVRPMEVTYEHRLLGRLHLGGVTVERRGDIFEIGAAQVRLGDLVWQDVQASVERRKDMLVVALARAAGREGARLSVFSTDEGISRWLFDWPHGPVRPWLARLGVDPGEAFAEARAAGSISLDIPEDQAQPVRGRVQVVFDDWPLFAPTRAEPLLGRTFSLLSNLVSEDGVHWTLPRVELTMPVFSLVGKGSLQLGQERRMVLEVEGTRTCRELGALLPASEEVRQVESPAKTGRAGLGIRWDIESLKDPLRPRLHFVPGCGLDPWPENR